MAVNQVAASDDEATMIVREFFAGNPQPRSLTVTLINDGQWQIDDIICQVAPDTLAELLYNEFILFMRYDLERGIERTPIADWSVYPWAQTMSEDVLTELLATYRSDAMLPADPFLCAQDVPLWVDATVEESGTAERVTVRVAGAYPSGPDTTTSYDLTLVEMALDPAGEWQVVRIRCAR